MRLLVLCTHNSARSQMAEGWLRHYAAAAGLGAEIHSAGTEATRVDPRAVAAMADVGIDISGHASKALHHLQDPWDFDIVLTVCDSANATCPSYPARTTRLHVSFPDPKNLPSTRWRELRDAIGATCRRLVDALAAGRTPDEDELLPTPNGPSRRDRPEPG